MARRSDHTREEIKEMAIQAGQAIIADEGFSGFSARKVAREIGYTVGTLYNVFESHGDLVLHINAKTLESMHEFMAKHTKQSDCTKTAIKALAASYIQFAQQHHNRWSALFEFTLPQDASLPKWYADKIKVLFTLIEAPLKPLLKGNRKRIKRAAKVLWASIHGICQLGLTGTLDTIGAESIQVLTDSLIDHYMRGLR